ncbi:hypothetical protein BN946_scf184805.g2 [Trametes cinnabarina]|uniref:HMG box domain-containing protein n=1 Tax=Pycnoporus cinnabarinus TaxID=5643 RepID=A0A060S8W5_PYCCI|nr:hypothetical protein BN946_scf184805.g2 [Trametes cinnabarina]
MTITYGTTPKIVGVPVPVEKRPQRPALTAEQREEAAARRRIKQGSLEEDIAGWYSETVAFADSLSTRYGNTRDHYVNMMFKSPDKLRAAERKPNAYNAFLHHLAKEAKEQDDDGTLNAAQLSAAHHEQYKMLSKEEKAAFIEELVETRQAQQYGLRLTQRARTLDINRTTQLIEELLAGLQSRVGIQAMYLIVRSNPELDLEPLWFFTDPALEDYLRGTVRKFEPERIGILAEAFSVAGSDLFSQLRTNREKVNWLKSEIRKMVADSLVEVTGDAKAAMSYAQYTRDIQLKYGVSLVGWTHEKWCNPSDLGNSLPSLKTLHDALKNGDCMFKHLTDAEKAIIEQEYVNNLKNTPSTSRKRRSDAGRKRKHARIEESDEHDE